MAQVLVDTSAVYALVDRDDAFHRRAVAILRSMPGRGLTPLLTNFIAAECHAVILSRLGTAIARRWLLDQRWHVEPVQTRDEEMAKNIIRKFIDKSFSTQMQRVSLSWRAWRLALPSGAIPTFANTDLNF
jgi:predicted nucleic acid-binding protein